MKNLVYAQPSIIQKTVHHIANDSYSMAHTVGHTVDQNSRVHGPYHIGHVISTISYCPYHMDYIMKSIIPVMTSLILSKIRLALVPRFEKYFVFRSRLDRNLCLSFPSFNEFRF